MKKLSNVKCEKSRQAASVLKHGGLGNRVAMSTSVFKASDHFRHKSSKPDVCVVVNIDPDEENVAVGGDGKEREEQERGSGKGEGKDDIKEMLKPEQLGFLSFENEIYIKAEPFEAIEEAWISDVDDEDIIIQKERAVDLPTSIPQREVIEEHLLNGKSNSLSPPMDMETDCSYSQYDHDYYQMADSWRLKFEQECTKIGLRYVDMLEDSLISSVTIEVIASEDKGIAAKEDEMVTSGQSAEGGQSRAPRGKTQRVNAGRGQTNGKKGKSSAPTLASNPLNPLKNSKVPNRSSLHQKAIGVCGNKVSQGSQSRIPEGTTASHTIGKGASLFKKKGMSPPSLATIAPKPVKDPKTCSPSSLQQTMKKMSTPSLTTAILSNPLKTSATSSPSSLHPRVEGISGSTGGQGKATRNTVSSAASCATGGEKKVKNTERDIKLPSSSPADTPVAEDQSPGATVPGWYPINPPGASNVVQKPGNWNGMATIPIRNRKRQKKKKASLSTLASSPKPLENPETNPISVHLGVVGGNKESQRDLTGNPESDVAGYAVGKGTSILEKNVMPSPQSLIAIPSNLLKIPVTCSPSSIQPIILGVGSSLVGQGTITNLQNNASSYMVVGGTSLPEKNEKSSPQTLGSIPSNLLKIPAGCSPSSMPPRLVAVSGSIGGQGILPTNSQGSGSYMIMGGPKLPAKMGSQYLPGLLLSSLGNGNNVTFISGNVPTLNKTGNGQSNSSSTVSFTASAGHQGSVSIPSSWNIVAKTCENEKKSDEKVPTPHSSSPTGVGESKIVGDPAGRNSSVNNSVNYKVPIPRLGKKVSKKPIKILPKLSKPVSPIVDLKGSAVNDSEKELSGTASARNNISSLRDVRLIPAQFPLAAGQQSGFIVQPQSSFLPVTRANELCNHKNMLYSTVSLPSSVGQMGTVVFPVQSSPAQTSQGSKLSENQKPSVSSSCGAEKGNTFVQSQGNLKPCPTTANQTAGVPLNGSDFQQLKVVMQPPLSLVGQSSFVRAATTASSGSPSSSPLINSVPLMLYKALGLEKDGNAPKDSGQSGNANGRQPIGYLLGGSALNFDAMGLSAVQEAVAQGVGGVGTGTQNSGDTGQKKERQKRWKGDPEEALLMKRFRCGVCDLVFFKMDHIDEHMTMHMRIQWNWCLHCWERFKHKNELQFHIHSHVGLVPPRSLLTKKCEKCGVSVLHRNFAVHQMIHNGERPFICEVCGKSFRTKGHLKSHLTSHQDERPFECGVCGKHLKRKSALYGHLMTHTYQVPQFNCKKCDCRFPTISRLRMHEVSHSEERNVECHICHKMFKTKCQMREHVKRHFLTQKFECMSCGQRFKERIGLKKHQNRLQH